MTRIEYESRYQPRLREIYSRYKLIPAIRSMCSNSRTFSQSRKDTHTQLNDDDGLRSSCYRRLPWSLCGDSMENTDICNTYLYNMMSNPEFHVVPFSEANITPTNFGNVFEAKARNQGMRSFELLPADFALEHRFRIQKLRFHQLLITGRTELLVNHHDYMVNIERFIASRDRDNMDRTYHRLAATEELRMNRLFIRESFQTGPQEYYDKERKFAVESLLVPSEDGSVPKVSKKFQYLSFTSTVEEEEDCEKIYLSISKSTGDDSYSGSMEGYFARLEKLMKKELITKKPQITIPIDKSLGGHAPKKESARDLGLQVSTKVSENKDDDYGRKSKRSSRFLSSISRPSCCRSVHTKKQ